MDPIEYDWVILMKIDRKKRKYTTLHSFGPYLVLYLVHTVITLQFTDREGCINLEKYCKSQPKISTRNAFDTANLSVNGCDYT